MSKVIVARVKRGSFRLPIEFKMLGEDQAIRDAVFDTGCAHSLISVDSLTLEPNILNTLQYELLTDIDIPLLLGSGIESSLDDVDQFKKYVKAINIKKEELRNANISKSDARKILDEIFSKNPDVLKLIYESKNIRYAYEVKDYAIDNMNIGDITVKLSFNTQNKNLIGMHIIEKLYTKIFRLDNNIILIASLDNSLLNKEEKRIIRSNMQSEIIEENIEKLEVNDIHNKIEAGD